MQIHKRPGAVFDLSSVHKDFGEAQAVVDVCRAAAPFPAVGVTVEALLVFVTAAVAEVSLRAGGCDGMSHSGCHDGVRERSLFTACEHRLYNIISLYITTITAFLQISIECLATFHAQKSNTSTKASNICINVELNVVGNSKTLKLL